MDDLDAYLTLWTAVIERAILDLSGCCNRDKREATAWILSDERHVGSFDWVCDMLQIEPPTRQQIRSMAYATI